MTVTVASSYAALYVHVSLHTHPLPYPVTWGGRWGVRFVVEKTQRPVPRTRGLLPLCLKVRACACPRTPGFWNGQEPPNKLFIQNINTVH